MRFAWLPFGAECPAWQTLAGSRTSIVRRGTVIVLLGTIRSLVKTGSGLFQR